MALVIGLVQIVTRKPRSVLENMAVNIEIMNKVLYIFIAIILFLIIAIGITFLSQDPRAGGGDTNVVYTDLNITFTPEGSSEINTSNFLNDPTVNEDVNNPGLYELGNTVDVNSETGKAPNYAVIYDKASGVFNIMILEKPFTNSRLEMEKYVINLLQTSPEDMCKLSYSVTVPGYVDQNASGQDYRFSFCPDAVQL